MKLAHGQPQRLSAQRLPHEERRSGKRRTSLRLSAPSTILPVAGANEAILEMEAVEHHKTFATGIEHLYDIGNFSKI